MVMSTEVADEHVAVDVVGEIAQVLRRHALERRDHAHGRAGERLDRRHRRAAVRQLDHAHLGRDKRHRGIDQDLAPQAVEDMLDRRALRRVGHGQQHDLRGRGRGAVVGAGDRLLRARS